MESIIKSHETKLNKASIKIREIESEYEYVSENNKELLSRIEELKSKLLNR